MNIAASMLVEHEKLLYKLVIQFLIFCQGSNKLLEPHLLHIGKRLKAGESLDDLTDELQAVSKTLLHISKQSEADNAENECNQQHDYLLQKIDELLVNASVPLRFQQQKTALRRRVKSKPDDEALNKIIDSAIALLLNIKDYAVSEQKDIDNFLSDLKNQLGEIEQKAEQVGDSTRSSSDERQKLNSEIRSQLENIKEYTHHAEELTPLKSLTNEQLDRLMLQLVTHRQLDEERQHQAEQQIEIMTAKLRSLETETESLRIKLKLEHDRAMCDVLTGLPNRLAYKDRIEMEASRWRRYKTPLSLAIWDIDFFKSINDNYGHKAGDKTLMLVGQLLRTNCRESDFVARYGGEEFVMLMPNTHAAQAQIMAENIRQMIEKCGFNHNGEKINLTLSCGICEFFESDQHDEVFVRADQALYQAKKGGRNRCEVYKSGLSHTPFSTLSA